MCSISMCVELAIHANITAEVSGAGFVRATMHADAALLLVVIAVAGLAITGMALYLVQRMIRRRKLSREENGPSGGSLRWGRGSRRERSGSTAAD